MNLKASFFRKRLVCFLFIVFGTINSEAVFAECSIEHNGSQWIECDGIRVSRNYESSSLVDEVQEIPESNSVVWLYQDKSFSSSLADTINGAIYVNSLDGSIERRLTQNARNTFSDKQKILEFQVVNHRAVWEFIDADRNCGPACSSISAYYYRCLADDNIYTITPVIRRGSLFGSDNISNFQLNGDVASWTYYDHSSGRSTEQSERLDSCSKPILINSQPSKPKVRISHQNDVKVTWDVVNKADYYLVAIKFNDNAWTGFNYRTSVPEISWKDVDSGTREYKVKACSNDGNCSVESRASKSSVVSLSTPSTPIASASGNTISVSWGSVYGASKYVLSIKFNSNEWTDFIYYTSGSAPSISWSNINSGKRQYKVKACDSNEICYESSSPSNIVSN